MIRVTNVPGPGLRLSHGPYGERGLNAYRGLRLTTAFSTPKVAWGHRQPTILITYSSDESPQIAATRTNWHWIEIAGFYIFMSLAPDTLLDNFQEADVQEQILQLENQIISLQEQLDETSR